MKVYIVIKPITQEKDFPDIIGVYKDRKTAEKVAYSTDNGTCWNNIIEKSVK